MGYQIHCIVCLRDCTVLYRTALAKQNKYSEYVFVHSVCFRKIVTRVIPEVEENNKKKNNKGRKI